MAMKMKQLINSMLLIVSVWTLLDCSVADQPEKYTRADWYGCGYSSTDTFTNGSAFQRNLNQVLDSLVGNVSSSGFSTSLVDEGKSSTGTVYGLLQCRGDVGSSDCKQCAAAARALLFQLCSNKTSGFLHLNGCFLRYESYNFYNVSSYSSLNATFCSLDHVEDTFAIVVEHQLTDISNIAAESPKLFGANMVKEDLSVSSYLYSIAECSRHLSPNMCRDCLDGLTRCQTGVNGGRYISLNCELRFEIYPFINASFLSSSPVQAQAPRESLLPSPDGKRSNALRIILGVVAAAVGSIAVIGLCKWNLVSRRKRWENIARTTGPEIGEEGEVSLCPVIPNLEIIFEYDILREATSNFKEEHKLGQGGFGSVYKGNLPDGRVVAVKRLYKGSDQGDAEFLNEANLIVCIQHKNLVKLLGCSFKGSERLLVYEYLPNSSLDKFLFDETKRHLLNWNERHEIIVGTARGLAYLHEESGNRIIHRDIKANNILLDNKLRPKIADFGLARFFAEDRTHVTTGIAGTIGYMAPEYAFRGQLTEKADVFSFGVLVLEVISGRKNHILAQDMEFLVEGTWKLYKAEKPLEIMDPTLQGSYSWEEGIRVIKIGLLCTQADPALRPSMSRVVLMLTGEQENLPSPTRPTFMDLDNVGTPNLIDFQWLIDSHKTSSSNWPSEATTSSMTPSTGNYSAADQVKRKRPTVTDADKTSSSNCSSEASSSSRTPSDIHFAADNSSSAILESRSK